MRTKRTNGGTTYKYVYYGGQLLSMWTGGTTVYFDYKPDGTPMGIVKDGMTYFYITNLQGDVVAIINQAGAVQVTYAYDAWGNLLSIGGPMASTLGQQNPLRYRGYVYDTETGLYYLQSRYYDPEIGRFLNADAFVSTGQGLLGNNMFAYCGNNPVNSIDVTGTMRAYVRDLAGVSQYVPAIGYSDGQMYSDNLLQHLKEQSAKNTGNTYNFTVQYVGIYTQNTDYTDEYWGFGIGTVAFVASLIPAARETVWISAALQAYSTADYLSSGLDVLQKSISSLPNKDYHQYCVTLSYYEDIQYNKRTYRTMYNYEIYYLWDDTRYSSPSWYMQRVINNTYSYYVD